GRSGDGRRRRALWGRPVRLAADGARLRAGRGPPPQTPSARKLAAVSVPGHGKCRRLPGQRPTCRPNPPIGKEAARFYLRSKLRKLGVRFGVVAGLRLLAALGML